MCVLQVGDRVIEGTSESFHQKILHDYGKRRIPWDFGSAEKVCEGMPLAFHRKIFRPYGEAYIICHCGGIDMIIELI